MVVPFSNGSEFRAWHGFNCGECYKYESESTDPEKAGCKLAYYLDLGTITGEIPFYIAKEIGIEYDGNTYVQLQDTSSKIVTEKEEVQPVEVDANQIEMEL